MVDATDIKNDPNEADGWIRRSILEEPRLSEVVQMYRDMGLEVKVLDLDLSLAEGCGTCLQWQADSYKMVYTRGEIQIDDELY